jgi:hypothetical protein
MYFLSRYLLFVFVHSKHMSMILIIAVVAVIVVVVVVVVVVLKFYVDRLFYCFSFCH